jgi:hypothetical protein
MLGAYRTQRLMARASDRNLAELSWRKGVGKDFFYYDGSLKGISVPTCLAELLSCKLLPTLAACKTAFVLYII